jgi:hypothetical protein
MVDKLLITRKHLFSDIFDALSLSGAIIAMFFSLVVLGVIIKEDKVWQTFGTALTTFVSGKKIGEKEVASNYEPPLNKDQAPNNEKPPINN